MIQVTDNGGECLRDLDREIAGALQAEVDAIKKAALDTLRWLIFVAAPVRTGNYRRHFTLGLGGPVLKRWTLKQSSASVELSEKARGEAELELALGGMEKTGRALTADEKKRLRELRRQLRTGQRRTAVGNQFIEDAQARLREAAAAFAGITEPGQIHGVFIANSASHAPFIEFGGKTFHGKFFVGKHIIFVQGSERAMRDFEKAAREFGGGKVVPVQA